MVLAEPHQVTGHPASPRSRNSKRTGMKRPLRWAARAALAVVALLAATAATGAVYEAVASTHDALRFPPPGRMLDVDAYRLHVQCVGQGSPTVLLDAVSGGWSTHWAQVLPEIAR